MTDIEIYKKITRLPADLKGEADDFIEFLLTKREKEISNQKGPLDWPKV